MTPNLAVVFAVLAFLPYWIAAMFAPPLVLRDVFDSLAFGAALIITVTWWTSAFRAVKENAEGGDWLLVLGIFVIWAVELCQRIYIFNYFGRPDDWASSAIAGFCSYSHMIAGLVFLSAPGLKGGHLESRAIWAMVAAVGIGCLIAGILNGASISTG